MIKAITISFVFVVVCLFSGCGAGGSWVDVPFAKCDAVPKFKTDEIFMTMARNGCSNAGKAFSGEARCEKNVVQVKCE